LLVFLAIYLLCSLRSLASVPPARLWNCSRAPVSAPRLTTETIRQMRAGAAFNWRVVLSRSPAFTESRLSVNRGKSARPSSNSARSAAKNPPPSSVTRTYASRVVDGPGGSGSLNWPGCRSSESGVCGFHRGYGERLRGARRRYPARGPDPRTRRACVAHGRGSWGRSLSQSRRR